MEDSDFEFVLFDLGGVLVRASVGWLPCDAWPGSTAKKRSGGVGWAGPRMRGIERSASTGEQFTDRLVQP